MTTEKWLTETQELVNTASYAPVWRDGVWQLPRPFMEPATTRLTQATNAIQAVLDAHRPIEVEPSETICAGCSTLRGSGETARYFPYKEWPCPTRTALDAALTEKEPNNGTH